MPIEILMPALSPTMEEGNLAKWLKQEGDRIVAGDVIAEIETDKATMEVEAVDEGTLGKILVAAGTEGIKVNTPIAVLLQDGESPAEAGKPAPDRNGAAQAPVEARPGTPAQARPKFALPSPGTTASCGCGMSPGIRSMIRSATAASIERPPQAQRRARF